MNKEQAQVLEVVQQVLRPVVLALAASAQADLNALCAALLAAGDNEALEPEAQLALTDLARGVQLIARATGRQPPGH